MSARHADGESMLVEVDAAAVAKLLLVRFIAEGHEVIRHLPVCKEVEQPQKLAVNATRDRHTHGQKRQRARPVRVVCVCVRAYSVRERDVFAHLLTFRGDISTRLGPFPPPDATERQQPQRRGEDVTERKQT